MIAQYFATKKTKIIKISKDRTSPVLKEIKVSGKIEARRLCKRNNITMWNF